MTATPWPTQSWTEAWRPDLDEVVRAGFDPATLGDTYAVVVTQGGRVVAEQYGGALPHFDRPATPVTAATPLISWSMAKSMTHFLVGTLVDAGRLDPHALAPVPEWADPADPRHAIRLADLLAMRDGLDFNESYVLGEPSHVIEMLFGPGQADTAAYTAALPLAHEPGSVYNYSSGTTNIVSRIVADQVGFGDAYRRYIQERLFDPLGMTSAVATFDDAGVFIGSSYVHATARDFAKFGYLYLRDGQWEGRTLVSADWVATARTPHSTDPDTQLGYSWHWWTFNDAYGSFAAQGYEGQRIVVVPALDAVIVRCGRTDIEDGPNLQAWLDRLIASLAYAPS